MDGESIETNICDPEDRRRIGIPDDVALAKIAFNFGQELVGRWPATAENDLSEVADLWHFRCDRWGAVDVACCGELAQILTFGMLRLADGVYLERGIGRGQK